MMKSKQKKPKNQFNKDRFFELVRKRYKKRYGRTIGLRDSEIMSRVNIWIEGVINGVVNGKKVKLDKHSYIQVIGTPVLEDEGFKRIVGNGRYIAGGIVKKADNMNYKRNDVKYKIYYVNSLAKEKIYFEAHKDFKKRVHKALVETNNYYKICNKKELIK